MKDLFFALGQSFEEIKQFENDTDDPILIAKWFRRNSYKQYQTIQQAFYTWCQITSINGICEYRSKIYRHMSSRIMKNTQNWQKKSQAHHKLGIHSKLERKNYSEVKSLEQ